MQEQEEKYSAFVRWLKRKQPFGRYNMKLFANKDNQGESRGGSHAAEPSKKQMIRNVLLCALAVLLLVACLFVIVKLVGVVKDVLTPPVPEQPDGPYTPVDDPQNPDGPGTSGDEDRKLKKNFFTFLIGGTNDGYNVDSIMVGSIDMTTLECNVISIPRDTFIDTNAKIKRINGTYGRVGIEGEGGLLYAVWGLTGIYPQYYCIVNMKQFIEIVDIIGGVDFNVPYNMYHKDLDPDFHIDLKQGQQKLDGKKALMLVRYRGTKMNDFGRMDLQKDFLTAMLKQVKNKFTIDKATAIITTAYKSMKTNMPLDDMIYFYTDALRKMNLNENIHFYTMPWLGTGKYNGQDYVYLNEADALELINKTINPYNEDMTERDLYIDELYKKYDINISKW